MTINLSNRVKYLRGNDEFPDPSEARADGLLAAGGDLGSERLLTAYSKGIFPWYDEWSPILWYSPPKRCIIEPTKFFCSKSLRQRIRRKEFTVTADTDFKTVIESCAYTEREADNGTWIVPDMISAYRNLHALGYAHSVEVWKDGALAGGLYGVSLGKVFFGESMFHHKTDASKVALYYLCTNLARKNFDFIDAQMETAHLLSLGAVIVDRFEYLKRLNAAIDSADFTGSWTEFFSND